MATQSVRIGWRPYVTAQQLQTANLLDSYSGAAAAYSLRKLRSSYSGSAIRVRRSSDNTELNIGFDSDGNLDTISLSSFVGSGNGFVTTWYDQSGSLRDITQSTAANQPKIVNAGSIYRLNGLPSVYFYDNFLFSSLLTMPINNVTNTTVSSSFTTDSLGWGGVNYQSVLSFGGLSDYMGYATYYTYSNGQFEFNSESRFSNYNGQKTSTSLNKVNLSFNYHGYTQILSWLNSNSFGSSTFSNTNLSTQQYLTVGSRWHGSGFYFHLRGYVSEAIIWNNDKTSNRTQIESNINTYYTIYPPTVSDTNAQEFLNAASITNLTQANAINTLVTELKSAGIWTKMKAIYPFVGGTAQSHKFNLKDPRDLDVAFRLTFSGGWTHSSTGILPNGTNAYADTKLIPSQQYSTNSSVSFGVYSRNDKLENSTELSAYSGPTQNMGMEPRWTDGKFYGYAWQDGIGITSVTPNSGSLGLLSVTRQSYNILKTFRNNILIGNQTTTVAGSFPTNSVRLSMGGVAGYSSREKAFAYIGDGISDNEISLLSTAIQRFQTSLSRHVGVPVGTILAKPVGSPNIVSTDLVFNIDPSNTSSYPGTGTTVYDLSGNNYTGTLQSGCYYDSESLGNFVFDGINDYINLPHSILSGTGDFTVNIWVKNINSTYGTIFANYPAGNLQVFYGSNSIGFWLNNDTAYMTSTNSNKETTTIPRMLTAIRRNGSILEVYLDGVLKKTGSSTATIGSVSNFRMGTNTVGTETMNTSIYTIQAYSRALSTVEITQNYNATKWRFGL